MERLINEIERTGRFETYLGGPEEAVYWYRDDAWIVRRDAQGRPYSVWHPTSDLLISRQGDYK